MRVCILGDGLSSLALAKALINENIKVDLLFTKKTKKISKNRTLAISKSNVKFFNKKIVNIDKILWNLNKIEIFSENLNNEKLLEFSDHQDKIFSIVKNLELYKILNDNLVKNKNFTKKIFKNNYELADEYNLIINTDYSNLITKKYFTKKIQKKYNSFAYTAILKHENSQNNTAIQIFTKYGPIAFLPISNFETSVVFSVKDLLKIDNEKFFELIKKYNFKYEILKINKFISFELKSLNLRSYYHKNILAFGDLIHRIHPLAGQGFNMTIRDINILIDIIKRNLDLGLPLDSSINSKFEQKAKHKNYIFSSGIDFIYEFFNFERKLKNRIISKSVQLIGKNSSIKNLFSNIADKGI